MKKPKEGDARPNGPGYGSDVEPLNRDSRTADAADAESGSGGQTAHALEPEDSSKGDASAAGGGEGIPDKEMSDSAAAQLDAGDSSPICCSST